MTYGLADDDFGPIAGRQLFQQKGQVIRSI